MDKPLNKQDRQKSLCKSMVQEQSQQLIHLYNDLCTSGINYNTCEGLAATGCLLIAPALIIFKAARGGSN